MAGLQDIFKNLPEFQMDSAKKKILLIYGGALLLVVVLYIFLLVRPSIGKLAKLIPVVRTLKTDIKAVHTDLEQEEKLDSKLKVLETKMGDYENKLSREKEVPVLLENLSGLAKNCRVKILGIAPKTKVPARREEGVGKLVYQEVPIAITAQSGYHELGVFINKLETDERFMQITDIKVKTSQNNSRRHDIEFVVYAYTFKSGAL